MDDLKARLERALETARKTAPPTTDLDGFVLYRERRERNRRVAAGAVALAIAVVVIGSILVALRTADHRRPGTAGTLIDPGINQACGPRDACWDADLYVMRADGSQVTRVGYDEQRDFGFSWSPDGERIAFYHAIGVDGGDRVASTADIYTVAADGSDVRRLTDDPSLDLFPVYSPDGSRIALTSDRSGRVEIYAMGADGTDVAPLTEFDDDPRDDYHPTWSPDGRRIAFVRGEVPPGTDGELWVMNADGSDAHILLEAPLVSFPSWSPDGTRIAFTTGDWPAVRVQILELRTGTVTDVIGGFQPKWSPDSRRLLVSIPEGSGGFGIVDLDAPHRLRLLRTSGWAAAWSPDGDRILFNDAGIGGAGSEPWLQVPPPGEAIAGFTEGGTPFLVVAHADGTLTAVEAISPHIATGGIRKLLGWCPSSRTFDDPFHGSRFDEFGRYVSGPSPSGLVPLSVEVDPDDPARFRLGPPLPAFPRGDRGDRPTGPLCMETPLVTPDIAESGLTPEELASSSALVAGSRWMVRGVLVLEPDGDARLCDSYVGGVCEAGATVIGLTSVDAELVVEGTWFVIVGSGVLEDPIRAA